MMLAGWVFYDITDARLLFMLISMMLADCFWWYQWCSLTVSGDINDARLLFLGDINDARLLFLVISMMLADCFW